MLYTCQLWMKMNMKSITFHSIFDFFVQLTSYLFDSGYVVSYVNVYIWKEVKKIDETIAIVLF